MIPFHIPVMSVRTKLLVGKALGKKYSGEIALIIRP